ncbi:RNA-binding cell elongation regulator Jag/EloR [Bacillus solitudinis]|uniref:RNA-binding cell elongation regulator Jag/EloR n=1 Tax=Bacillus solitudinis TaxID=2014074 RepID=UPI000C247217|nr:RNA-binding cell elongation regulator Jag/EloR [Bacillus solitudinis]
MTNLTISGKTIEEAIKKAIIELETTRERLSYEVLVEPQKGFLGFIGSKPAIIKAYVKPDSVDEALFFLQETLDKMSIVADVTKKEEESELYHFHLNGSGDIGRVIGKRGQTLDALEYLTNLVANRKNEKFVRIQLDAENYREKRRQTLVQLAHRVGEKVRVTNQKTRLEPMSGSERKIIHASLQGVSGIQTYSQGQGPNRHIVIAPEKQKTIRT